MIALVSCGDGGLNYSQQDGSAQYMEYDLACETEDVAYPNFNTESYAHIVENDFLSVIDKPLSTFSIDVDNASYANIRRFINNGNLPPADAVRIEEMINYFNYDYPSPTIEVPFNIVTETATCPWNQDNLLLHIGLQGYSLSTDELPASNLVFLVDVSGSMNDDNKLPLLVKSLSLLVDRLNEKDQVALVVYAGSSGVVLEPTTCNNKGIILDALERLEAGGSTNGVGGIELAYELATEYFIEDGNNRVILATDGDFNVGQSSDGELTRIIEEKRDSGIYLTVLGFGMGNYKDSKMETIADNGNGNYFYIDELGEAKKVLVDNLAGTLMAIAKDVKIQVEFNPTVVASYRLIGYENRLLNDQDFKDDKKDAGELGAGHSVTALYELTLSDGTTKSDLKYQQVDLTDAAYKSGELCNLKFRYKPIDSNESIELTQPVFYDAITLDKTSNNFRWSSAVASFGMILRGSQYAGDADFELVLSLAHSAIGENFDSDRNEFIALVENAQLLQDVVTANE